MFFSFRIDIAVSGTMRTERGLASSLIIGWTRVPSIGFLQELSVRIS